jgi:predicted GNAT superfamily acetyltransferase
MTQHLKPGAFENLGLPDIPFMLPLNNSHARETSLLDEASLAELLRSSFYARGIGRGSTALLIALDQSASYSSPNFLWFKAHRDSFVYIDRIIVSSEARGQGLAKGLYQDLFAAAKQVGHVRVVCEVNIDPPNPASEAFHALMGFVGLGEASIHDGAKSVRYLEKILR